MPATVVQMARSVRAREISPVELMEEALERAEAWQPSINAFSQIRPEDSMAEARARADAVARGEDLGPLAGVPVVVKDLFDVAGWETTGCCRAFAGRVALRDAEAVRRLRSAGAVVAGKANQHELAAGATNLVSACGRTGNPWDPDRITGGSSGGSAAAVSAGIAPLALGSDTGGSIRIPASMCGVTGLKPTYGLVSLDRVMPLSPSMDTAGPLARTVTDVAVALAVLSGRPVAADEPVAGMSIGVLDSGPAGTARADVLGAVLGAADVLAGAGVRKVHTEVRGADDAPELWERIVWPEFATCYPGLEEREGIHRWTRSLLALGRRRLDGLEEARERMKEIRSAFLAALDGCDALLLATTPIPATPADVREVEVGAGVVMDVRRGAVSLLTRPVNLAGLPALALPAGWSSEGMPVGIQLVAADGREDVLLRLGTAFQEATDHHLAEPGSRVLPGGR